MPPPPPAYAVALTDELAFATLADGRKLDQLEPWNRAILRPSDVFREPPRTEMSEPRWGVEDHADELPNWFHRRQAQARMICA